MGNSESKLTPQEVTKKAINTMDHTAEQLLSVAEQAYVNEDKSEGDILFNSFQSLTRLANEGRDLINEIESKKSNYGTK